MRAWKIDTTGLPAYQTESSDFFKYIYTGTAFAAPNNPIYMPPGMLYVYEIDDSLTVPLNVLIPTSGDAVYEWVMHINYVGSTSVGRVSLLPNDTTYSNQFGHAYGFFSDASSSGDSSSVTLGESSFRLLPYYGDTASGNPSGARGLIGIGTSKRGGYTSYENAMRPVNSGWRWYGGSSHWRNPAVDWDSLGTLSMNVQIYGRFLLRRIY